MKQRFNASLNALASLQTIDLQLLPNSVLKLAPKDPLDPTRHFIDRVFLREYLTVLNVMMSNLDIHTILWSPATNHCIHKGIDWSQIHSAEDLLELSDLMHKIFLLSGMMPQTIMMDIANGAKDIAAEWALLADCRLMDQRGHLIFDHSLKGLSPLGGASVLLQQYPCARQWALSAKAIEATTLLQLGFINETYNGQQEREDMLCDYFERQQQQSAMARIQTKQVMTAQRGSYTERLRYESSILRATLSTQDWLKYKNGRTDQFIAPSELQSQLRQRTPEQAEV